MPQSIVVTPEDIYEVARAFECGFGDEHRREVLQCTTCRDIQACPGGGKTTLLVAKLAILSKKWRWRDRGICVMSHTNVAREEVERRLANHPTAHRLLGYPHFIGTIQVFVDRFLALPYLRNKGVESPVVDDERYEARVLEVIRSRRYLTVYNYVSKRFPRTWEKLIVGLRLECVDGELKIGSAGGDFKLKDTSKPTYQQLRELKKQMWEEGLFRYDEMYAFAQVHVNDFPQLTEALQYRFPWVFVDEMQDTDAVQESLLLGVFSSDSIVQRFGDINQAIFGERAGEGSQTSFPLPDSLYISQ